jgi:hypothetical protein
MIALKALREMRSLYPGRLRKADILRLFAEMGYDGG